MKKHLYVPWLLPMLMAAGFTVLSCNFSNNADGGIPILTDQDFAASAGVVPTKYTPADAWACCFSRQANWGRINSNDRGNFNTWGDFRPAMYLRDGRFDTMWQSNYWSQNWTLGDEHHNRDNGWDLRHWVMVDLGEVKTFNIIKLYSTYDGGAVREYEIYNSNIRDDLAAPHPDFLDMWTVDAAGAAAWGLILGQQIPYWDKPDVKIMRADGDDTTPDYNHRLTVGALDGRAGEKTIVLENPVTTRYVMLRSQKGQPYADRSIAEFWVENWDVRKNEFGRFTLYKDELAEVFATGAIRARTVVSAQTRTKLERLLYGTFDTDGTLVAEGAKQYFDIEPDGTWTNIRRINRQVEIDANVKAILTLLNQLENER